MDYFVELDDDNRPVTLYRGDADIGEQVWHQEQGWVMGEFLLDCLQGWGSTYHVSEEQARQWFPAEAFADSGKEGAEE